MRQERRTDQQRASYRNKDLEDWQESAARHWSILWSLHAFVHLSIQLQLRQPQACASVILGEYDTNWMGKSWKDTAWFWVQQTNKDCCSFVRVVRTFAFAFEPSFFRAFAKPKEAWDTLRGTRSLLNGGISERDIAWFREWWCLFFVLVVMGQDFTSSPRLFLPQVVLQN